MLAHGCEFIWNLAPGTPTLELPFIAMVWDLQHRLQPYFPEVSAAAEWQRREALFRELLQRAAYVVTGNASGQQEIERFYHVPPERIRRLPHPTPRFALTAPPTDPGLLARWNLAPGYLFYPAQFWPHKNHAGLLRAAQVLRNQFGLRPPLVLVGADKSNLGYVRRLADELGVADQLRVLGFVSREELVALYRHALALVYLTYFGPENLPPLEAMALGCPVIASRVSGADEQLGDAALLVDPRDPLAIAQSISDLAANRDLRSRLVERGAVRARRHTADDFVRGVLELLDEFAAIRACWDRQAG
jgi:glycosyltransferase involved in cell wall biosynthesis